MARAGKLDLRVFQQELATRLASKTAAQVASSRLGLAAAGQQWLLRLDDTGEVIPLPALATVPLTRPWFLGVANIRGNLCSVVDFAGYLGAAPAAAHASGGNARLVVFGARTGDLRAGIAVPRVLGLRNLAELAPAVPPPDAPAWYGQRWIDADGAAWQEIDLAVLAREPRFLQVGL
jgi:twitching motility protein PilI